MEGMKANSKRWKKAVRRRFRRTVWYQLQQADRMAKKMEQVNLDKVFSMVRQLKEKRKAMS